MAKTFRHAHDTLTFKRPDKAFRSAQRRSQRAKDMQLTRRILASPSLEARAVFSAR
jgi:hypothetical protein